MRARRLVAVTIATLICGSAAAADMTACNVLLLTDFDPTHAAPAVVAAALSSIGVTEFGAIKGALAAGETRTYGNGTGAPAIAAATIFDDFKKSRDSYLAQHKIGFGTTSPATIIRAYLGPLADDVAYAGCAANHNRPLWLRVMNLSSGRLTIELHATPPAPTDTEQYVIDVQGAKLDPGDAGWFGQPGKAVDHKGPIPGKLITLPLPTAEPVVVSIAEQNSGASDSLIVPALQAASSLPPPIIVAGDRIKATAQPNTTVSALPCVTPDQGYVLVPETALVDTATSPGAGFNLQPYGARADSICYKVSVSAGVDHAASVSAQIVAKEQKKAAPDKAAAL